MKNVELFLTLWIGCAIFIEISLVSLIKSGAYHDMRTWGDFCKWSIPAWIPVINIVYAILAFCMVFHTFGPWTATLKFWNKPMFKPKVKVQDRKKIDSEWEEF